MKKLVSVIACAVLTALLAGNAAAAELRGRFAVTGRVGITNPANSERDIPGGDRIIVSTDAGIIGGGGFLFGVDDHIAAELDITRSAYHTSRFGTANVTNLSIGAQYRLPERQQIVSYFGAGLDVLIPDLPNNAVSTEVGAHIATGLDFFLNRQLALNAEVKGVEAFSGNIRDFSGAKVGQLDPSNLSFTIGARFFFN